MPKLPLLLAALMPLAATAANAAPGAYYVATPDAAPHHAGFITGETPWSCAGGVCTAMRAPDRDANVCRQVARQVGPLARFSAGGADLDAAGLAACNAHAK